jgi:xanthine dehydrogenase small subunit
MIRFLLNNELRHEDDLDPNLTVLRYLREQRGKTGTKEGCASGDCGACTVVLAEPHDGRLRYRAINACITPVASLHGKQLISVEDLKQGEALHPVQRAMADMHGSQCGFCTPGFVMSMFALSKHTEQYHREEALEALAGNLCRCTGYRPILDATAAAMQQIAQTEGPVDGFDRQADETLERLQAIAADDGSLSKRGHQGYLPTTLDEVTDRLASDPAARLVAGATDLALEITQQHQALPALIHLDRVEALQTITERDGFLDIGAAAPLTDCYDALATAFADFGELLGRFASTQIRNRATLGGNIATASPIGDTPPLLIALGASVRLRSANGYRDLALEDFFLDYRKTDLRAGELIERVFIPLESQRRLFAYKVSKRFEDDISAVCGAFAIRLGDDGQRVDEAQIAFGGMAATPARARGCETALQGAPITQASLETACAALDGDFTPISDFRASREYRQRVARNLLRRVFIRIAEPRQAVMVSDYE